jgi:hypothetical protein
MLDYTTPESLRRMIPSPHSEGRFLYEVIELLITKRFYLEFLFPVFAAFSYGLLFPKLGLNYAERLVFFFYLEAHAQLLSIWLLPLALINQGFLALKDLVGFGFFTFAVIQFSGSGNLFSNVKATVAFFLSRMIHLGIGFGLSALIIYLLHWWQS